MAEEKQMELFEVFKKGFVFWDFLKIEGEDFAAVTWKNSTDSYLSFIRIERRLPLEYSFLESDEDEYEACVELWEQRDVTHWKNNYWSNIRKWLSNKDNRRKILMC